MKNLILAIIATAVMNPATAKQIVSCSLPPEVSSATGTYGEAGQVLELSFHERDSLFDRHRTWLRLKNFGLSQHPESVAIDAGYLKVSVHEPKKGIELTIKLPKDIVGKEGSFSAHLSGETFKPDGGRHFDRRLKNGSCVSEIVEIPESKESQFSDFNERLCTYFAGSSSSRLSYFCEEDPVVSLSTYAYFDFYNNSPPSSDFIWAESSRIRSLKQIYRDHIAYYSVWWKRDKSWAKNSVRRFSEAIDEIEDKFLMYGPDETLSWNSGYVIHTGRTNITVMNCRDAAVSGGKSGFCGHEFEESDLTGLKKTKQAWHRFGSTRDEDGRILRYEYNIRSRRCPSFS